MTVNRSFDLDTFKKAVAMTPTLNDDLDCAAWLADERNIMWVEDDNVALATFEYPGVYTAHWFFNVRGKKALELAKRMLDNHFKQTDTHTLRGLTSLKYPGARWLARQVGFQSYGMIEYPDETCEIFCLTREQFYKDKI